MADETSLTLEQVAFYKEEGYLLVHDLLTEDEVQAFLDDASGSKPEAWAADSAGVKRHLCSERALVRDCGRGCVRC